MDEDSWVNDIDGLPRSWRAPRCIFHIYSIAAAISACLITKDIFFLGGSPSSEVLFAMESKLDENAAQKMGLSDKHQNLQFSTFNVTLHFIWDAFMNSTLL